MNGLEQPRERIAEIDREIIGLIAARMEIAKTIGQAKKERAIPLRDWEVEKRVLDRAAERAVELGLSSELVRSTMQLLIEEACVQQERLHYSAYRGNAEDILIIGGAGKMGRWFARFFQNQGHRVAIHDIVQTPTGFPFAPNLQAGLDQASFALIATPLENVPDMIHKLTELRYQGTVVDIASLKGHLKPAIAAAREKGLSITSIHPMFGALARTLSDKVICLCDCGDRQAAAKVEGFFRNTAVKLVHLSLDEHDRLASYVLGLSHLINLLFTAALTDSEFTYEQLRDVGSTTFASQMETSSTVIRESPELYYAIQRCNPYTRELYRRLRQTLDSLTDSVLSGNREAFVACMKAGKDWLTRCEQTLAPTARRNRRRHQ